MTRLAKLSLFVLTGAVLSACGGGGGSTPPTPPPPPPADTTNPSVSFSPDSLTVNSGETGSSTLTATDNVGITTGPDVTCNNGGSFSGSTYTAPTTTTDLTDVCTATAGDAAGNTGTGTLTVSVIGVTPDSEAPVLAFDPSSTTAMGGEVVNINLTATDNVGITTGPTVTCDNGGDFFNNQFTAPDVSSNTTVTCTATASDAAGNSGMATLTVDVTPAPDVLAPTVAFTPTELTVASGGTGMSTLTASDDVGVTVGPTVTCDNGGSFANDTFTAPTTAVEITVTCTATAEDAAGNQGSDTLTVTVTAAGAGKVNLSGTVTFDFVPHDTDPTSTSYRGLDYPNTMQKPVRGATVELLNNASTVLDTTQTDDTGNYTFSVDQNVDVQVRVKSELVQTSGTTWDVKVTDNTAGNGVYALQGTLTSSGSTDSIRDLHAASGWSGTEYTATRAAAPFAIMDPVYTGLKKFEAIAPGTVFPPVEFRWSVNNTSVGGDLTLGQIGTSSYVSDGTTGNVYILGDADNDTDEYDRHVVVHEWGHYFEDRLSRSDSVGGSHSLSNRLDMRVAMGEGWGNALSAMILDDPVYRDSLGDDQGSGFDINVENDDFPNDGWFNEESVQSIIYDIYDSNNEGADAVTLGLAPIFQTMTASSYTGSNLFTSIYLFLNEITSQQAGNAAAITALATDQNINSTAADGAGETNDGTFVDSLPVYKTVSVGGGAVQLCVNDDNGTYNRLGNRQFLTLNIPTTGTYTLTMNRTSGPTSRDPDFYLFQAGVLRVQADQNSVSNSQETFTGTLQAGDYAIDAHDWQNLGGSAPGDACFNFTVTN